MKVKDKVKNKYSKKVNVTHGPKKLINTKWVFTVAIAAFIISMLFAFITELIIPNTNIGIAVFLLLLFIILGIIFDMIGIAVTVGDKKVFHSMAAKQISGAKVAVKLISNSDKVSSFCNDVIGDICGIVSGSTGVTIATVLISKFGLNGVITSLVMTALISALTIGGKAAGKSIAINKSNVILFSFSKVINIFYKG